MRRSVLAALVASGSRAGAQFVILLLIARLADARAVGEYTYALAICAPLFIFLDAKLRTVQAADAVGQFTTSNYIGQRLVSNTVALAIVAVVAILYFDSQRAGLLIAVAFFKAAESMADILNGALQRKRLFGVTARQQSFRAIIQAFVFACAFAAFDDLIVAVLGMTLSSALVTAINYAFASRLGINLRPSSPPRIALRLFSATFLVAIAVSLGSLTANVPRYFIEWRLGLEALGVYALISYGLFLLGMVVNAFAEVQLPRMSDALARRDPETFLEGVRKVSLAGALIGATGIAAVWLIGEEVISWMFGPEYGREWQVLIILLVGGTFQYCALALGVAFNAARLFSIEMPIQLAAFTILALACLILIKDDLAQAAIATVVSNAVVLVGYAILFRFKLIPHMHALSRPTHD